MAKRKSVELWDEPDETQDEGEGAGEPGEGPVGSRATPNGSDDDWEEDDASDDGWLDDSPDDLESEMRGCDEGEVYRLLGRPGRRGQD